jgi:hypothetical protein
LNFETALQKLGTFVLVSRFARARRPCRFGMLAHGTIRTLVEVRDGGESAHGSSVRVMGVLESFDPDASRGVIAMDGASLAVDVSLVPGADPHRVGSMYQYIGEVDVRGADRTLRARVARCVDGLDVEVYKRALQVRRKFLRAG